MRILARGAALCRLGTRTLADGAVRAHDGGMNGGRGKLITIAAAAALIALAVLLSRLGEGPFFHWAMMMAATMGLFLLIDVPRWPTRNRIYRDAGLQNMFAVAERGYFSPARMAQRWLTIALVAAAVATVFALIAEPLWLRGVALVLCYWAYFTIRGRHARAVTEPALRQQAGGRAWRD